MTEQEFHRARRMFFVTPAGNIILAAEGDPRSHYECLALEFGDKAQEYYRDWTRGYFYGHRVVAYKGQDFEHRINHEGFAEVVKLFWILTNIPRYNCSPITEVGIGINLACDRSKQPWEPKIVEDVDVYLEKVAIRKGLL